MAVRLKKQNKEPFWLEQGPVMKLFGVKLKVKPQDSALQALMQETASQEIRELVTAIRKIKESGGDVSGMPDLEDEAERAAYFKIIQRKHAGFHAIVEWEGVLADSDDEKDQTLASVNRETITDLLNIPGMGLEFETMYDRDMMKDRYVQNFSSPAPNGTSEAGENTATSAALSNSHAPEEKLESTDNDVRTSSMH